MLCHKRQGPSCGSSAPQSLSQPMNSSVFYITPSNLWNVRVLALCLGSFKKIKINKSLHCFMTFCSVTPLKCSCHGPVAINSSLFLMSFFVRWRTLEHLLKQAPCLGALEIQMNWDMSVCLCFTDFEQFSSCSRVKCYRFVQWAPYKCTVIIIKIHSNC